MCTYVAGSGKSTCFSFMVNEHIKKGGKALILTHRIELLKQTGGYFEEVEELKAGNEPDKTKPLICGMVETLYRRIERYKEYLQTITLLVIDEMHSQNFDKIYEYINKDCFIIGVTATPLRKGNQTSLDKYYTDIVQEIDTPELIDLGYLAKCNSYGVDINLKGIKKIGGDYDGGQLGKMYTERKIYEGVIENYNRICPNTKALLFASSIESSKRICNEMTNSGLPAKHVDSEIGEEERGQIMEWFKNTKNGILCNVGIINVGYDCPDIKTIILYRATLSLTLFLQMCGRGSRISENKGSFNILDFGNNVKTHDFWEAPRTWSIEKEEKKKKAGVPNVRICVKCGAILPLRKLICPYCGQEYVNEKKKVNEFADLVLMSKGDIFKLLATKSIEEKVKMAKAKVVHPFAILHRMTDKEEAKRFVKEMGYKPQFVYMNKDRFKVFN